MGIFEADEEERETVNNIAVAPCFVVELEDDFPFMGLQQLTERL